MIKYYCDLCGKETNDTSYCIPIKIYGTSGCTYFSKYLSKEVLLCSSCRDKFSDFALRLAVDDELYERLKFDSDD